MRFKENIMKISARNIFEGKITALVDGKVSFAIKGSLNRHTVNVTPL